MIRPGMIQGSMKTIRQAPGSSSITSATSRARVALTGRPCASSSPTASSWRGSGRRSDLPRSRGVDALHLDTPGARPRPRPAREEEGPDAYGLVAGYRRVQAALLLLAEGRTSERFDGSLSAVIVDALDDRAREDRNLSENVEHDALTPMDEAIVLGALTADPPEGHGENDRVAVSRLHLRGGVARARTLLRLLALIPEAQDLVRLHHYDPELGIPVERVPPLAGRAAEVQAAISRPPAMARAG